MASKSPACPATLYNFTFICARKVLADVQYSTTICVNQKGEKITLGAFSAWTISGVNFFSGVSPKQFILISKILAELHLALGGHLSNWG